MAKERRDSKNRILNKGEYQKPDGRYMYRYTGTDGKPRFVYSWTLTKSDRLPKGKPTGPCLRDIEIQITKDMLDGINSHSANNTVVDDYFRKYMEKKKNLKQTTRNLYRNTYETYLSNRIGLTKISSLKYSDIVMLYNNIIDEHEVSISAIESVDCILKPILNMAVRDELIRNNPADGVLSEVVRERGLSSQKRKALTLEEQNAFMRFIETSNVYSKWKNLFIVMLGTGCRIGEICGLTWDDCDFAKDTIAINRTMCYSFEDEYNGRRKFLQTPKSNSGSRTIPMLPEVKTALQEERRRQLTCGFCKTPVDGLSGFVFLNTNNEPLMPRCVNSTMTHLVSRFNTLELRKAKENGSEPFLLPNITPHVLRHTFCTRMREAGVDIKVVQEVMGHARVEVTLDIYNTVTDDFKKDVFKDIDLKINAC